jgi:hypothetical protein
VDALAYVGEPDLLAEADVVHVSVSFKYDLPEAERLERAWRNVAPVVIGGPAAGDPGDEFEPGKYLAPGYVFTSRGCPNRCWYCDVWQREGQIRELEIKQGWNVLDSNLLACSDEHIRAVFAMLATQPHRPRFTGGLDAERMQPWIAEALREIRTDGLFLAYDKPEDYEPVAAATRMLWEAGFSQLSKHVRCFVLVGYRGDTFGAAEDRLRRTLALGLFPMAMLYRADGEQPPREWREFARQWARPFLIACKMHEMKEAVGGTG